MKGRGLQTMIRLQRWQLDELRRQIAPLELERAKLMDHGRTLLETLHRENQAASADYTDVEMLNNYRERVQVEQVRIADRVSEIEQAIDQLRERMAAAFQDVKKYEITEEQRLQAYRRELEQKEQERLDEVALNGHRRRSGGA